MKFEFCKTRFFWKTDLLPNVKTLCVSSLGKGPFLFLVTIRIFHMWMLRSLEYLCHVLLFQYIMVYYSLFIKSNMPRLCQISSKVDSDNHQMYHFTRNKGGRMHLSNLFLRVARCEIGDQNVQVNGYLPFEFQRNVGRVVVLWWIFRND